MSEIRPRKQPGEALGKPLSGVRICLVFEHSLTHYTRILQEMDALLEAGASLHLLTSLKKQGRFPERVPTTIAPLDASIADSRLHWRPARVAHNLARNAVNSAIRRISPSWDVRHRIAALRGLAPEMDLFWVVDFPSLATTLEAASATASRIVYETLDLVPEYPYRGDQYRRDALAEEARLVRRIDGFITACDGYREYYLERYGRPGLPHPPVVVHNVPHSVVQVPNPTSRPLKMLFLGSLMNDRPLQELIEAVSLAKADFTLTFQGRNLVGDVIESLLAEYGVQDKVRILDPCPPADTVKTASAYDVGIVALRGADENERRASTSKLFTYMAAGLAIVGSDLPGIARVVNERENGVLVSEMSPATWADAFEDVVGLADERIDIMKGNSVEAARVHLWTREKPKFVGEFVRALGRDA